MKQLSDWLRVEFPNHHSKFRVVAAAEWGGATWLVAPVDIAVCFEPGDAHSEFVTISLHTYDTEPIVEISLCHELPSGIVVRSEFMPLSTAKGTISGLLRELIQHDERVATLVQQLSNWLRVEFPDHHQKFKVVAAAEWGGADWLVPPVDIAVAFRLKADEVYRSLVTLSFQTNDIDPEVGITLWHELPSGIEFRMEFMTLSEARGAISDVVRELILHHARGGVRLHNLPVEREATAITTEIRRRARRDEMREKWQRGTRPIIVTLSVLSVYSLIARGLGIMLGVPSENWFFIPFVLLLEALGGR